MPLAFTSAMVVARTCRVVLMLYLPSASLSPPSVESQVADPRLLGPAFGNNGKDEISVLNCMLHNAGPR